MSVVNEYVNAIMRRRREPMEPLNFEPNWADQPRRHKVYDDVVRLPLPLDLSREIGSVDAAARTVPEPPNGSLTLADLGRLLHDAYGIGGRRLGVNANTDVRFMPLYTNAAWSRGTASGGGLYPLEIYWVCGASGPMLPGVYHYLTAQHALQRLLVGDLTGQVRAALADSGADVAGTDVAGTDVAGTDVAGTDVAGTDVAGTDDQFLLVTVKLWKNAFKYNSFSYHAVTMDLGTLLGTWQMWARAAGTPLRPWLWFDEPALNELLNLETSSESVFAVVPLPLVAQPSAGVSKPDSAADAPKSNGRAARVTRREQERSRTVLRFEQVEQVHLATVATGSRPGPEQLKAAEAVRPAHPHTEPVALAEVTAMPVDVASALRVRRSSFGRFASRPKLSLPDLGAILAAATAGGRLASDVKPTGTPELVRLVVFANHVAGLPAGIYDYDPERAALDPVAQDEVGTFLQRNYFLPNYNVEQAAAVLTVLARPEALIDAVGPRGYRLVNAEVGAVAQAAYTACAALGVGCGAALGFDNVSYAERLGITGTGEWPVLMLMVGHDRPGDPNVDHRLY
jgi:SagB-type dehydrogenase family enzyme